MDDIKNPKDDKDKEEILDTSNNQIFSQPYEEKEHNKLDDIANCLENMSLDKAVNDSVDKMQEKSIEVSDLLRKTEEKVIQSVSDSVQKAVVCEALDKSKNKTEENSENKTEEKVSQSVNNSEANTDEKVCQKNGLEKQINEEKVPVPNPNVIRQKIASLNENTLKLREKLAKRNHDLDLRLQEVQQNKTLVKQNDLEAKRFMTDLTPKLILIPSKENSESGFTLSNTKSHHNEKSRRPSESSANHSKSETKITNKKDLKREKQEPFLRLTRRDLLRQIEGFQELTVRLVLQQPEIMTWLCEESKQIPKLKNVELFPMGIIDEVYASARHKSGQQSTSNNRQKGGQDPFASKQPQQQQKQSLQKQMAKQRHESERSTASSLNSQKAASAEDNTNKSERKRRRKNKKHKSNTTTEASEKDALCKYINSIVAEYLGEAQKQLAEQLTFTGGVDDLEKYAQRLVDAGLGRIVEDEIRINRKNNRQSFVTMSSERDGAERDGIVLLPIARRYAFEGDTVRAFVMNAVAGQSNNNAAAAEDKKKTKKESVITGGKDHSFCIADDEDPFVNDEDTESEVDVPELDSSILPISDNCPKAFVIAIVKNTDLRQIVGTISFKNTSKLHNKESNENSLNYYKLKPHDMRVPMVYIPVNEKSEIHVNDENKNDICGMLYLVQVLQTDINGHCIGELVQPVGKVGDLEAEIKAILLHNGLKDILPYEQKFVDMFAEEEGPITEADSKNREDLRSICIFTIDPLTARDLDDAMSIEFLDNGVYEVGVHISDVSRYLEENSELDNIVKHRATSIYLVNEVIHMLPQSLCFKCSLLPGEDKFAFSVFWRLNSKGQQLASPRFARTLINSCTQFAYEHAQKIIDNPDESFGVDDFPTILNGYKPDDIAIRVRTLHEIAQQLRQKRYDDGALSINNPKVRFQMDPISGEPIIYEVEGRKDANFLIEEFMLLANQSVARFIYDRFPDTAILRNHAAPLSKSMKVLREKLANFGMELDCSNSKTIYESMKKICATAKDAAATDACLNIMLTKPMARAKYFCSEGKTEESDLWHYALSIPIYTHFTSPIRRYPDVLVHRLLAAGLNYCPAPQRSTEELHQMAKICNDQKFNAKNAGDESTNLFFKRYIKSKQFIVLRAVVYEIFQNIVNVVTIETGHSITIHYKMQKVLVDTSNAPNCILISEKNSKQTPMKLQLFTPIDVKLVVWDEKICGFFVSPDPKQRQLNSVETSKKKQQPQNNINGFGAKSAAQANGAIPKTAKPKSKPKKERIYSLKSDE